MEKPILEQIDTGIPQDARKDIVEGLSRVLADSYTLYLKTHGFHWNVTGRMFQTLHLLFERQYTELAGAVDVIAERIRALGAPAPGSYAAFARLASIPESEDVPAAHDMVRQLVTDHETLCRTARSVFPAVDRGADEATRDLLIQRLRVHEKEAWMLRALLEG